MLCCLTVVAVAFIMGVAGASPCMLFVDSHGPKDPQAVLRRIMLPGLRLSGDLAVSLWCYVVYVEWMLLQLLGRKGSAAPLDHFSGTCNSIVLKVQDHSRQALNQGGTVLAITSRLSTCPVNHALTRGVNMTTASHEWFHGFISSFHPNSAATLPKLQSRCWKCLLPGSSSLLASRAVLTAS